MSFCFIPAVRHATDRASRYPSRRASAFTLVELLVVIGIIALLISILLPSLNSARQAANKVKCLSNLRSIGQAIGIYTGTSKGTLPYGYWNGTSKTGIGPTPAETDRATDWAILITSTLGKGGDSYTNQNGSDKSKIQGMFTCPTAKIGLATTTIDRTLHYSSHPRLMPDISPNNDGFSGFGKGLKPYKLTSIKRGSEIVLIFDAIQMIALNGNANAVAVNLDADGLYRNDASSGRQWNFFVNKQGMDQTQAIYVPKD
ncbi:MAG: hypothetical protein JWM57_3160, partial [Phycisphaerales bacterium]|nr:hypothetical protein [Phycisphaerales bacterium]